LRRAGGNARRSVFFHHRALSKSNQKMGHPALSA
jgi:hypothetical protein